LSLEWRVKSFFKDFGYHCELLLYTLILKGPSKKPFTRYKAEGAVIPDHARPVCLFSSYDDRSIVKESVHHYLQQLKLAGFDTVFISTSAAISASDLKRLANCCIRIISRDNKGYDFYSWKIGLEQYSHYHDHAGLLLANDSVYGPLFPFGDIITRLENSDADIIGMTDNFRYYPHLQSYFIYFKRPVVLSKEFVNFFDDVRNLRFKRTVIRKYEVGLAKVFDKKFRLMALYPLEKMLNEGRNLNFNKSEIDPTFRLWASLIIEFKFPFLKKSLFKRRGVEAQKIAETLFKSGSTFCFKAAIEADILPSFATQLSLSIAMATHNGERYLAEQLDSILCQSRLPDELIIHDDASSDTTESIIRDFASRAPFPVRLKVHCRQLGSTNNFAGAIRECNGEIIFLCDQDDIWHPNKLALIEECFMRDAKVNAVFSDARVFHQAADLAEYKLWDKIRFSSQEQKQIVTNEAYSVLLRHPVVTGATMAFRSSLRDLLLPIPDAWVHDAWISLLIGGVSRLAIIPEQLISYRQHDKNQIGVRRQNKNKNKSLLDIYGKKALGYEMARTRMLEFPNYFQYDGQLICSLDKKIAFLHARSKYPKLRCLRWPFVMREFVLLRYSRYSMGLENLFLDLVRLDD
jgi:glycosyltransferase involved in cell wall biosynthesis